MANLPLRLALRDNYAADGVTTVGSLPRIPFTSTASFQNNMNERTHVYDGYTFKTDWNGSTNYMRFGTTDLFNERDNAGLRLYTSDTIGKDRDLMVEYMNTSTNVFPRNCIGYTGLWKIQRRDCHPRLDNVCLHYMNSSGVRTKNYLASRPLYDLSSTNHTWRYATTGTHDSDVNWRIGYTIDSSRYNNIIDKDEYLCGITLQIRFRTAGIAHTADGMFYSFKPIISRNGERPTLETNKSTLTIGSRQVLAADLNQYPVSGDLRLT